MTTIGAADGGLLGTLCSYKKGCLRGPLRKSSGARLGVTNAYAAKVVVPRYTGE